MRRSVLAVVLVAAAGLCAGLTALGVWQVERRAWKLDLIQRIDERVHAGPVAPPPPSQWADLAVPDFEYRRVTIRGCFLHDREALVQAVTERGGGFWVVTPFEGREGFTVLVNRGFVLPDERDPASRPVSQGEVSVTGLMRASEPEGAFLRDNDPAAERWFSRDVAAIAAARNLERAAHYFIDAEAGANGALSADVAPVGGLTRISFPNNHLVYALTWFALAAMVLAAALLLVRREFWGERMGEDRTPEGLKQGGPAGS